MDLIANLGAQRLAGQRARHTHSYRPQVQDDGIVNVCVGRFGCGRVRDEARATSGKSANRLGKDQERRIERVYGPRKVGEFGDAIDLIGRDFKWQSKATRAGQPNWFALVTDWTTVDKAFTWVRGPIKAMEPLHQELRPLLIRVWVRKGVPPMDIIIVRSVDWRELHGEAPATEYMAMTGAHFLDVHGRDTTP